MGGELVGVPQHQDPLSPGQEGPTPGPGSTLAAPRPCGARGRRAVQSLPCPSVYFRAPRTQGFLAQWPGPRGDQGHGLVWVERMGPCNKRGRERGQA